MKMQKKKVKKKRKIPRTRCSNCGEWGSHLIAPSFGEPKLFICKPIEYKIVTAKCENCNKIKRLSFEHDTDKRYTWCINCQEPVIWREVKKNE